MDEFELLKLSESKYPYIEGDGFDIKKLIVVRQAFLDGYQLCAAENDTNAIAFGQWLIDTPLKSFGHLKISDAYKYYLTTRK